MIWGRNFVCESEADGVNSNLKVAALLKSYRKIEFLKLCLPLSKTIFPLPQEFSKIQLETSLKKQE